MYLVESKAGDIVCMVLALLFLGTWPAILTLLERRGRLPVHTYHDYTVTNLLAAVIIAFTFCEIGKSTIERQNFLVQLSQDNWPSILFVLAGGVVLILGNLSTQYAWALVGLSITGVITASITVVIGTTLNYFLDDRINKAEILFPGVGCFLIAVCLGSFVQALPLMSTFWGCGSVRGAPKIFKNLHLLSHKHVVVYSSYCDYQSLIILFYIKYLISKCV